jgi:hypothetical protein
MARASAAAVYAALALNGFKDFWRRVRGGVYKGRHVSVDLLTADASLARPMPALWRRANDRLKINVTDL